MTSQYWKMLFNAAYQAEVKLDDHIERLKVEYRISDDEIKILETLYKECLLANNSMVTQQMKEELKPDRRKYDAAVRIAGLVVVGAISICGTLALAMMGNWN